MNKMFFRIVFLFISVNILNAQDKEFLELVNSLSLKYENASKVLLTKKKNDTKINSQYSIGSNDDEFKILYSILPATNFEDNTLNKIYLSLSLQFATKISEFDNSSFQNNKLISEFEFKNVSEEFNADWGGTSSIVLPSDKFTYYKFCIILYLFKKDKGLVTTCFLFNDEKTGLKRVQDNFYNLMW